MKSSGNILSFCLNTEKDRSDQHSPGGRYFHSWGPAAEKLLSANLL